MKRHAPLLLVCSALAYAACANDPWRRAVPASFLPVLDLRLDYSFNNDDLQRGAQRRAVTVGASLRWRPRGASAAFPSQVEQSPAVWLAPCALDDFPCLTEVAEVEAEIADGLRHAP